MSSVRRQTLSIAGSLVAVIVMGTFITVRGADGTGTPGVPAGAISAGDNVAGRDADLTASGALEGNGPDSDDPDSDDPGRARSGSVTVPALSSTASSAARSTPGQFAQQSGATTLPTTTVSPWPSPPADPSGAVAAAVAEAAEQGVRQSVQILDRSSGAVLAEHNPDRPFPALSLVKLLVAADLLDDASSAGGRLDGGTLQKVDEMIAASDDVAGSDLYAATGGDEMVVRVADRFGLTGTSPTPDGRWWGNVQTTATDMALLLRQLLADPVTSRVIAPAMQASTAIAADGVDQRFGMRIVPGAGVKQGWGCCLSGVLGVHSVGFTDERIVVVLSAAEPQDYSLGSQDGLALQADAGGQISIAAVTATVQAALGGSSVPNRPGSPTFMPAG